MNTFTICNNAVRFYSFTSIVIYQNRENKLKLLNKCKKRKRNE